MSGRYFLKQLDWLTILLYILLVAIGWTNIYSSTFSDGTSSVLNLTSIPGKQLFFIGASIVVIVIILSLDAHFHEKFSSIIYLLAIASLILLYPFGKTIAGATSWYSLGSFGLQPSELVKVATAIAIAKYLSNIQTDIKRKKDQLYALLILFIPAILIILQPDPGSALVFFALIFVIFREGMPLYYLGIGLFAILLFASTLIFDTIWISIVLGLLIILYFVLKKASYKVSVFRAIAFFLVAIAFSLSVKFVFNNIFEQHHRDRIGLWLRLEKDPKKLEYIRKTIGYNSYQSEKAIESGGLFGKGFLGGTSTKGDFVPEQHTDYIFTTVGEEWGFIGTITVIILFTTLLLRLVYLSERQKNPFSRMYGYGVISILFIHYFINIGMAIGILPTVGIPLPFFSYGGSGLLGFTILLFIFLKLDSNRIYERG